MDMKLLRNLPQVDELIQLAQINVKEKGETDLSLLCMIIKKNIASFREGLLNDSVELPGRDVDDYRQLFIDMILETSLEEYYREHTNKLHKIINCTGIVLHTNLGRAPVSKRALDAIVGIADSYSNLEIDMERGERGSRYSNVESIICRLTGSEGAVVVNNNAAAVMLMLHALGYGKKMIISRGELVEIGGHFRIPTVMEISGAALKEVGCTNKTYISDYEEAIDDSTGAVLKVHPSNFVMNGFTHEASLKELCDLCESKNIPLIYDMGSGRLNKIKPLPDLCSLSGDKLLGGPQCGIIFGKKKYIDIIKKDNLLRALRVDKFTLAALEGTLLDYEEGNDKNIPINVFLERKINDMEEIYADLIGRISPQAVAFMSKCERDSFVGGGSMPEHRLSDLCIAFRVPDVNRVSKLFRDRNILGYINESIYFLDLRCVFTQDIPYIAAAINEIFDGEL